MRLALPLLALSLCLSLGTACSGKRPVLYPNTTLKVAGQAQAEEDVDACVVSAKGYGLDERRGERVAERTVERSAVGSAAGAAGGAVWGNPGRGAATGAAAGAAGGFVRGIFRSRDPDPLHKRYVEVCLRQQGYQVLGWR